MAGHSDDRIIGQATANDRGGVSQGAPLVREGDRSEYKDWGYTHFLSKS